MVANIGVVGPAGLVGQGPGCGAELGPVGRVGDRVGQRVANIHVRAGWREAIGAVFGHGRGGRAADGGGVIDVGDFDTEGGEDYRRLDDAIGDVDHNVLVVADIVVVGGAGQGPGGGIKIGP